MAVIVGRRCGGDRRTGERQRLERNGHVFGEIWQAVFFIDFDMSL